MQLLVTLSGQDHVTNWSHYTVFIATKMVTYLVGHQNGNLPSWTKMVTYLPGNLPKTLNKLLIKWSYDVTRQTKTVISTLLQCLWPPVLAVWWQMLGAPAHYVTRSLDHDKPKPSFLYHNVYDRKKVARWWLTLNGFYP